jgi:hypothetical protein
VVAHHNNEYGEQQLMWLQQKAATDSNRQNLEQGLGKVTQMNLEAADAGMHEAWYKLSRAAAEQQ